MKSHITLALFFFYSSCFRNRVRRGKRHVTADNASQNPGSAKLCSAYSPMISGRWPTIRRAWLLNPNWEVQFNPPEWRWWRWVGSPLPYDRRHSELYRRQRAFFILDSPGS